MSLSGEQQMDSALAPVAHLADWSGWVKLEEARKSAPRTPGVYLAREGPDGPAVYVGMAGERRGMGVRGRISVYASGKGLVSGIGEAALDRVLADPAWISQRLAEAHAGTSLRSQEWGRLAVEYFDLHFAWAPARDRDAARILESKCEGALAGQPLWNRRRRRQVPDPSDEQLAAPPEGEATDPRGYEPEIFYPELYRRVRGVVSEGGRLPTLSTGSENVVGTFDRLGMEVKTPEAARQGKTRRVPAHLFNAAWDELHRSGQVSRRALIELLGATPAKRSSAVLSVLARFPEVSVAETHPILLRLDEGADG